MLPHKGLQATYTQWLKTRTDYERRRLLFYELSKFLLRTMTLQQSAKFLIAVRRPQEALDLLTSADEQQKADPATSGAMAWAFLSLMRGKEAVPYAKMAVETDPESVWYQVLLADALHVSNQHAEAHAIYERLIAAATPSGDVAPEQVISEMFATLFARETGAVPSSIYAMAFAKSISDPKQSAQFWQLAETEFYDSAYFRADHARYLLEQGDLPKAVAKLAALVQENPGLREPTLNLAAILEKTPELMPELRAALLRTIAKNGWTTEGMCRIDIDLGG